MDYYNDYSVVVDAATGQPHPEAIGFPCVLRFSYGKWMRTGNLHGKGYAPLPLFLRRWRRLLEPSMDKELQSRPELEPDMEKEMQCRTEHDLGAHSKEPMERR